MKSIEKRKYKKYTLHFNIEIQFYDYQKIMFDEHFSVIRPIDISPNCIVDDTSLLSLIFNLLSLDSVDNIICIQVFQHLNSDLDILTCLKSRNGTYNLMDTDISQIRQNYVINKHRSTLLIKKAKASTKLRKFIL